MIAYVMVGTNDLDSAVKFYDRLMPKMNMVRVETNKDFAAYAPLSTPENIEFYITKHFVADCHRVGIDAGGQDEGAPGFRPEHGNIYYAYVRDLDGNKLCFLHEKEFP